MPVPLTGMMGLQPRGRAQQTYNQFLQEQLQQAQQQAQHARQMYETVQAGAPEMPGGYIDPMLHRAARYTMAGGMSPQEMAKESARLGQTLGSAVGRARTAGGRRGFDAPGTGTERPLREFAVGHGELAARRQGMVRAGRKDVMRTMAGVEHLPWEAAKAAQTGYGEAFRRAGQARQAFRKPGTSRPGHGLYWWG